METKAASLYSSYLPAEPSALKSPAKKDLFQKLHAQGFLDILLCDRSTGKNLIWATDTYAELGKGFAKMDQISPETLLGRYELLASIRKERRLERTRKHGEVATPLPICKMMCDYVYRTQRGKDWQKYVNTRVLEITCGEAPFLVSCYDPQTGAEIPVKERIGILDRKLQVCAERTANKEEWLPWAYKAYEATYGYEFQGDNLLMARIKLLESFKDYMGYFFNTEPAEHEYRQILEIISWNIWQMDGLTGTLPFAALKKTKQSSLFAIGDKANETPPCLIKDWQTGKLMTYLSCGGKMKFDFIIGNPPYQEDRRGESTTALPIYDKFIDAAYELADAVELITPARFLFNSGRTPKEWNEKMLNNEHLKVLLYEKDASKIFPWTDIKGGLAITYHDKRKKFKPIKRFSLYPEMIAIINKIFGSNDTLDLSVIAFVATKFDTTALFSDYPNLSGRERRMSSNVLKYDFFNYEKNTDSDIMIYGIYNNKRTGKFINYKYVDMSEENIRRYKIVTPKADGNGLFGDTITNPEILPPQSGFTHTFLGIGGFDKKQDAESALKYIKTKFARSLLSVLKVTQDLNADKLKYIPLQDFSSNSDIDWSKSIPEIDRQLYAKYGLDEKEIEFIESHVKEMQ